MEIDIEEYFDTTTYDVFTFASEDFSIINDQLEPGDHYNKQVINGLTYICIDKSISIEAPELTKL